MVGALRSLCRIRLLQKLDVMRSFDTVFAVRADTMTIEKCLPPSALVHTDSSATPVTEPNRRLCTSSAMPIGPRSG